MRRFLGGSLGVITLFVALGPRLAVSTDLGEPAVDAGFELLATAMGVR
jgi:hypothetical protein